MKEPVERVSVKLVPAAATARVRPVAVPEAVQSRARTEAIKSAEEPGESSAEIEPSAERTPWR